MAELTGSESKYANQRAGATQSKTAAAAPSTFGSSIVAPPISGPLQNIVPGSQEWINSRMATIIEQLKAQYGDAAARRGMLQSGASEEELAQAVAEAERNVAAEAGQYNAQINSREDAQEHERQIARENARAQEKAAMFQGIGQVAPYALFGKWGKDDKTLGGSMWDSLKGSGSKDMSALAPAGAAPVAPGAPAVDYKQALGLDGGLGGQIAPQAPKPFSVAPSGAAPAAGAPPAMPQATSAPSGTWDKLKSSWEGGGTKAGLAGTGVGMMANSKNALGAGIMGGISTFGNSMSGTKGFGNFALPALAAGLIQTKGKVLKGDNLWKNLLAGGAAAYSFMK